MITIRQRAAGKRGKEEGEEVRPVSLGLFWKMWDLFWRKKKAGYYCMDFAQQQRTCAFAWSCAAELSQYTQFGFLFYWYSSRVIATQQWQPATVVLTELTDNFKSSPAWRSGGYWTVFNHRLITDSDWLIYYYKAHERGILLIISYIKMWRARTQLSKNAVAFSVLRKCLYVHLFKVLFCFVLLLNPHYMTKL